MRIAPILLAVGLVACSSSDFTIAPPQGSDTGTGTADVATDSGAGVDAGGDAVADALDAVVLDGGGSCGEPVKPATTTVYVDAAAAAGGNGSAACPFRTLAEAAGTPNGAGPRTVLIHAGTYPEVVPIKVRSAEVYRADGSGAVKVVGKGTTPCAASSGDSCTFQLDANSKLDGLTIEGGSVANGVVASGGTAAPQPSLVNTTVRSMLKDGVVVLGVGAKFGPNTHIDGNAYSGVMVRNGRVDVTGIGNTFDGNKGGTYIGATYVSGSGIHVLKGASLFVDGGATANNNHTGVFFDAGGAGGVQTLSQLTATGNRSMGVFIAKGWQVTLRKCTLNKNTLYGLSVSYDSTTLLDIGGADMGNNVFGLASAKNGKAGLFLCRSPKTGSQQANGCSFGSCPPTQAAVANCDAVPAAYVDVAYSPDITGGESVDPLALPSPCGS